MVKYVYNFLYFFQKLSILISTIFPTFSLSFSITLFLFLSLFLQFFIHILICLSVSLPFSLSLSSYLSLPLLFWFLKHLYLPTISLSNVNSLPVWEGPLRILESRTGVYIYFHFKALMPPMLSALSPYLFP